MIYPVRIALTNPTNWPLVRRGVERFMNELAEWLASQGHEVTIISAHPGAKIRSKANGFSTVMHRRLWRPWMEKRGILEFHLFFFTALGGLLRGRYDVVLSCTFMDALAASVARRLTGAGCIFWVNGLPPKIVYQRALSAKGRVFGRAVRAVNEVVAISDYMRRNLFERFGRGGVVIPPPVNLEHFRLNSDRDHSRIVILCTAALDDRRKGGKTLMRAFNRIKPEYPEAILQISCILTEAVREHLLGEVEERWRGDVQMPGPGELADLPKLLGEATVTVLASRWEPFGMVVLESLATGTPVAATRDGALPEVLNDPNIGRLFDPGLETEPEPVNVEGLVEAILGCIELSRDPNTPLRCRRHAEQYGWNVTGPVIERLLESVARGDAHPMTEKETQA